MASRLPAIPRVVFTVLEPISLIAGAVPSLLYPDWFINEQLSLSPSSGITNPIRSFLSPGKNSASALLTTQQLGNAYLLACMVGLAVLYTSSELKVVRNYLIALLVADVVHVALTYRALLGQGTATDVRAWNALTWGNVGATSLLGAARIAYLLGLFGRDLPARGAGGGLKKTQ